MVDLDESYDDLADIGKDQKSPRLDFSFIDLMSSIHISSAKDMALLKRRHYILEEL